MTPVDPTSFESTESQLQARFASDRELRLRVVASNYGRNFGWYVECDGQRVATLADPQWDDMFWTSYAYAPVADATSGRCDLDSLEFWLRDDLIFRSREFDLVVPYILAAGAGPQSGRISMRGLYFSPRISFVDRVLLWWRRRRWQTAKGRYNAAL
jgi:hypothetical protein